MAPPSFSDLGKKARDVFKKHYNYNYVKLDCSTTTKGGMEFSVSGSSNIETGKVVSSLETTYDVPEYGLSFSEKWSTDNVLSTEIYLEDKPIKGCKLSVDGTLVPHTGKKSATVKSISKFENLNLHVYFDVDRKFPVCHTAAVMGLRGWLVGGHVSVNACNGDILRNTVVVGYATDDFVLHTKVQDGQEYSGSVYQKVNENLETGVNLAWSSNKNTTTFGLGCVYSIDKHTSLRAKVNNSSKIGLGLSHRLRKGIRLTLSAMIDGRNFNQGGHKLGLGLDFEA